MEVLDKKTCELVEKGLGGNGLSFDEMEYLYGIDPMGPDAALVRWAANKMAREATDNKAEIHAQIGLNSSPCANNCKFCSFAVCNGLATKRFELSEDDVKSYADAYMQAGANVILMLTTSGYPFEKLLHMMELVRKTIDRPEMVLLAKTGDMTLDQARELKRAGADGAYHAIRMREGIDTNIDPAKRLKTIENLQKAGLSISTCVEPVGPEHSAHEIAEASKVCMSYPAQSAGVGRRVLVPGTIMDREGRGQISEAVSSLYVAVYGLATGFAPKLNCSVSSPLTAMSGGNLCWAEVGTNPRDTSKNTEKDVRGSSVLHCRSDYEKAGWDILEGPSQGWKLP